MMSIILFNLQFIFPSFIHHAIARHTIFAHLDLKNIGTHNGRVSHRLPSVTYVYICRHEMRVYNIQMISDQIHLIIIFLRNKNIYHEDSI